MEQDTAIDDICAVQRMVNRHARTFITRTDEKGMVFVPVVTSVVGQKVAHAFAQVLIRHYHFPNREQGFFFNVGPSRAPTSTHVSLLQYRKTGFFNGFVENAPIISLFDDSTQWIAARRSRCLSHCFLRWTSSRNVRANDTYQGWRRNDASPSSFAIASLFLQATSRTGPFPKN